MSFRIGCNNKERSKSLCPLFLLTIVDFVLPVIDQSDCIKGDVCVVIYLFIQVYPTFFCLLATDCVAAVAKSSAAAYSGKSCFVVLYAASRETPWKL